MENVEVRTDDQNRYVWDSIRSTYIDGVLSDRLISYDNGTTAQSSYMDGIRFAMLQSDSQLNGGVKNWETIETFYGPDGSIAGRVTKFDNGVIKDEIFENGVRSQITQMDNPQYPGSGGAKAWDRIVSYYDENGQMAGRVTEYDNGIVKEETFENGVRSHTRQMDNPQDMGGSGAKSWDEIDTYYDAAGKLAGRVTKYDNGIVKEETFEDGVRSHTRQMDNPQDMGGTGVKAWDTIDMYYDEAGQLTARVINYDDGRVRQDSYENGVRSTTEIQDSAYEGDAGNYAWTAINMYYDENGDVAQKVTVYDDGRVRQDDYVDGVRTSSVIEDRFLFNGGNYAWDTQQFVYNDDGSIASREISYDDGDAMLQTYVGGNLFQKSDYDGDGSEVWVGRTVTYNDDGSVASTETYDTEGDLPEDFFVNPTMDVFALG